MPRVSIMLMDADQLDGGVISPAVADNCGRFDLRWTSRYIIPRVSRCRHLDVVASGTNFERDNWAKKGKYNLHLPANGVCFALSFLLSLLSFLTIPFFLRLIT